MIARPAKRDLSHTRKRTVPSDVYEIRIKNLRQLCGTERGGRRVMADRVGMSEVQLSQLIGNKPSKRIGGGIARRIEERLNLARGWLDAEHHDLTDESLEVAKKFQSLKPEDKRAFLTLLNSLNK